ncbi:MAG TPA: hypothetical protein VLK65_11205 [Vicinamibacteria bacterium]|nr:hypothetical protein [Vicinamibacteria bacterium]
MRVRWGFIHGARTDLTWYIGSSLAGWLYVVLVLTLGRGLDDPIREPFYTVSIFGGSLSLTLGLLVVASWALLIDAPHVWATLARTWLDPDEWSNRRGILLTSTIWFALGPATILGPYVVGAFIPLEASVQALPAHLFFVFFRLWAYYHVVRQHWGFLVLYKKKNDDIDPIEDRADFWFFNLALYLPLILFIASPWFESSGMPSLGIGEPLRSTLRAVVIVAYPFAISSYSFFQIHRYRAGHPRNGPKLLFLLSIVPLHLVVFSHPLLALFIVPVVTVGHNLQYHRIVWAFGRNKYAPLTPLPFRWARAAFRSVPVYFALGLAFTFLLYQGPWIEVVKFHLARLVDAFALIGGVSDPRSAHLGARVAATLFLGWAMQHYYLDAKIWRVRTDPSLARYIS